MKLNEEQLSKIHQAGLAQLTIREAADLMEIPESVVCEGEPAKRYYMGQLQGKALAQTELFRQAKAGNPSALRQYVELCNRNQAEVEK